MNSIKIAFVAMLVSFLLPIGLQAQDFVYKPINSSFGGEVYNYNWLLSSATNQNRLEDPSADDALDSDALDDFEDNINRQILNQLSSQLVNSIFGDDTSIDPGSYNLGSYQVDISEDASGITINVQDNTTGDYTNVVIPSY